MVCGDECCARLSGDRRGGGASTTVAMGEASNAARTGASDHHHDKVELVGLAVACINTKRLRGGKSVACNSRILSVDWIQIFTLAS